jgi:hypothetical protein
VARTLARLHTYTYSWSAGSGLWVNLYGGNTLNQPLPNGGRWHLTQTTDYPWSGTVRLEIAEAPAGSAALNLRIPAWAEGATVKVNGRVAEVAVDPGTYARIEQRWQAGDTITLELPLEVQMIQADPLVAQAKGQAAVQRGPLVYCLETADLPDGMNIDRILLPREAMWMAERRADLLGGVTVLETEAVALPVAQATGGLYRRLPAGQPAPQQIRMIPYYAWNNRGAVDMSVWLPLR